MEIPRKAPAVERCIDEIREKDARVRVIGEITKSGDTVSIKDESSKIKVDSDKPLEEGKLVRIFGRPVKTQNGLELSSEFVQNMSELNRNLYKTIQSLNKGDTNE